MQKTDFPFEVVIGEDCSTDRTRAIVCDYQKRNPDKIRIRLARENLYSQGLKLGRGLLYVCRGKYIAICEGDDYWTDPLKLQKQVKAMQRRPECDLCFHPAMKQYEDGSNREELYCHYSDTETIISLNDVILGGGGFMPTASLMIKKEVLDSLPSWFATKAPVGDTFLQIYGSIKGGALFIPDVMAVYRCFALGSWGDRCKKDRKNIAALYEGYACCFSLLKQDLPEYTKMLDYRIAFFTKQRELMNLGS